MHSLTVTLLRDIKGSAEVSALPHPRDLRAAALAYYRHFTAFLTGSPAEQDALSKAADRILDKWELICEEYYASFPETTPEKKLQTECHTAFTELLNYLNGAPETPVKFRKYIADLDFDASAKHEEKTEEEVPLAEPAAEPAPGPAQKTVFKPTPRSQRREPASVKKPIPTPAAPASNLIHRLRIDLEGAEDSIWRRVYVPATTELADLHRLIQILFDWNNDHLHRFKVNYDYFGPANPDGMDQRELYDGVTLESIYATGTNKLRYTYDFADKWEHLIVIEKTIPRDPAVTYPLCTNGAGKAPLDGSGGTETYVALAAALEDLQNPKYDLAHDVLGRDWEPEYFSTAEINELIRKRW